MVTKAFRDAGCAVVGLDRSSGADLSTAAGAKAAVEKAVAELGGLDVVLHLVGGFALGTLAETGDDVWEKMMTLNFRSALFTIRAALPALRANGWGHVVVIGSPMGAEPRAGLAAYAVSKAALHALVRSAADELAGTGITVNAILPNTIDTEANRKAMPDADTKRWVKPERMASLMLWMASEEGRDMTGALVGLNGEA